MGKGGWGQVTGRLGQASCTPQTSAWSRSPAGSAVCCGKLGPCRQQVRVQMEALPFVGCVSWGKSFNLTELHAPHLELTTLGITILLSAMVVRARENCTP